MKIFLVAGARPNFMKIAPLYREAKNYPDVDCRIVHTGQHYDYQMSRAFFEDLGIPEPDFHLKAGSGSHAVQTSKIMVAFEELCQEQRPFLVVVVGDVNSTLACSIVAKKLFAKVAHVEAGLRSNDFNMPEEINRRVTDAISDCFFVTEESGTVNLIVEGKSPDKIHFVGNVMIDNLFYQLDELNKADLSLFPSYGLKEEKKSYTFLTLHRPSNVDCKKTLEGIASALNEIAEERSIFFPVHPRTEKRIDEYGIKFSKNIILLPPLGFKESLFLWKDAEAVLTDSGGLQEETTALGVPCITLRENTERPITLEMGSNVLAGVSREGILAAFRSGLEKRGKSSIPPKWDGHASERIWKVISGYPEFDQAEILL